MLMPRLTKSPTSARMGRPYAGSGVFRIWQKRGMTSARSASL